MIIIFNSLINLLLFLLLLVFPFSYTNLNTKWDILLGAVLGFIVINLVLKKFMDLGKPLLLSAMSIIFLIIYDFSEKVNFSQLFTIQTSFDWRIPLSTVILSFAVLIFILKILMEKRLVFNLPEYFKYFLAAITFILILMVLFYPFMKFHYNMSINSNIQFLNKTLKYTFLLVLILSHSNNESNMKKLNIGLIVSISIGLLFNVIL